MSKITAEIEVKQGRVSDAVKGVAKKVESAFEPIKRNQQAFARLGNSLRPVAGIARSVAGGLAIASGAALAVGGAMAFGVKRALDLGGRMSDLEAQTGIAAGGLMRLTRAFENNGLSAEQVGPAVNKMQRAIVEAGQGITTYQRAFDSIGMSHEELARMKPEEQFAAVQKAIAGLNDPTARAAVAMQIFGRSGAQMLALFSDANAMGQAAKEVGKQAEIMDRNAALFDGISDKLTLAGLKVQGFFVGIADNVAPVIEPLLDWFANQDLAEQGQKFGMAIATAITMLTDGTIGQTLMLMVQNAGMAFNNLILSGINQALDLVSNIPGLGSVGGLQISEFDRTGIEAQIGANVTAAMNRVMDLREAADRRAKEKKQEKQDTTGSEAMAGTGYKLALKQMFSTNMGLFVKDAMVSEQRRANELLKKIDTGIQKLKMPAGPSALTGGLRFT